MSLLVFSRCVNFSWAPCTDRIIFIWQTLWVPHTPELEWKYAVDIWCWASCGDDRKFYIIFPQIWGWHDWESCHEAFLTAVTKPSTSTLMVSICINLNRAPEFIVWSKVLGTVVETTTHEEEWKDTAFRPLSTPWCWNSEAVLVGRGNFD